MSQTVAAPNYVSSAFYWQYNLILLGGSALFSLASASPLPLLIGLVAEGLWLGVGPRLGAFRRYIDEQRDSERHEAFDDSIVSGMRGLGTEHTQRLAAVGQAISVISLHASSGNSDPALRSALVELEQLRPIYLRFCQLHERLTQKLHELVLSPPQQEVQLLSQAYAAEKDLGARFSLHQAIKAAQKKIEQQGRMTEARRSTEQKLALVEQALAHLHQQLQHGMSAPELARDISNLVAQVGTPAQLEAELGDGLALSLPPPSVTVRSARP